MIVSCHESHVTIIENGPHNKMFWASVNTSKMQKSSNSQNIFQINVLH